MKVENPLREEHYSENLIRLCIACSSLQLLGLSRRDVREKYTNLETLRNVPIELTCVMNIIDLVPVDCLLRRVILEEVIECVEQWGHFDWGEVGEIASLREIFVELMQYYSSYSAVETWPPHGYDEDDSNNKIAEYLVKESSLYADSA